MNTADVCLQCVHSSEVLATDVALDLVAGGIVHLEMALYTIWPTESLATLTTLVHLLSIHSQHCTLAVQLQGVKGDTRVKGDTTYMGLLSNVAFSNSHNL